MSNLPPRHSLHRAALLTSTATLLLAPVDASADRFGIARKVDQIERRYGVRVHYRYDPERYFPRHKREAPFNARCTQATDRQVARALVDIERFLSPYRPEIIRANLGRIFFCDKMWFHGHRYAGTYIDNDLYVDDDDPAFHLHHEFSSVVMQLVAFPWSRWQALRGRGPDIDPDDFLKKVRSAYKQSRSLFRRGYFIAYAQSNVENDFNVMATYFMTERARLWRTARRYPKLRQKYEIVRDIYRPLIRRRP